MTLKKPLTRIILLIFNRRSTLMITCRGKKLYKDINNLAETFRNSDKTNMGLTKSLEIRFSKSNSNAEFNDKVQSLDDTLIKKKKAQLKLLKQEEIQYIAKAFGSIAPSSRKVLLPKVAVALFGESIYTVEIIKCAQQNSISFN